MGLGHPLFGGKETAAMFYFYKSFWSVMPSQALETPLLGFRELNRRKSCWTWPGSAPKPPRPSPEPCWTWPGSAPKPPRPSPEPSPDLLRNLLRNPVEPSPGSAPKPPRPSPSPEPSRELRLGFAPRLPGTNLLRNPVEPDLALHQSLPNLLRNLLRNLFERDLALHQSPPDLLWNLRNLLRNLVEPVPLPAPVHTAAILGWRPH